MMKRLFIAIDLDEPLRKQVESIIVEMQERYPPPQGGARGTRISWVKPENVHLTLKFLGNTREEDIPAIEQELQQAVAAASSFRLILKGISNFTPLNTRLNRLRTPYPFWIGGEDLDGRLGPLVQDIEQRLSRLGFPMETRPFVPHFTIARIKNLSRQTQIPPGMDPSDRLRAVGELRAKSVILFESQTLPTGSVYQKLGEWFFS